MSSSYVRLGLGSAAAAIAILVAAWASWRLPVDAKVPSDGQESDSAARSAFGRPNVIIFLPDTLRADYLSCYGYPHPTSPNLDALAKRGVLFERCYAQSSWTKPSVASLLTGLLPSVHQAVIAHSENSLDMAANVQLLRDVFVTLGEAFHDAGYQTALFQMNGHVQKEFGFAQGFDHYLFTPWEDPAIQMDAVLRWLETEAREPFLLYVHLRDPHGKYTPPPESVVAVFGKTFEIPEHDREIIEDYENHYAAWVGHSDHKVRYSIKDLSPEGVEYLRKQYAAEVRYTDLQMGRLLEKLEALQLVRKTTIAVVADHGEAFLEHGTIGHGQNLFDEVIHVPLIIAPAGRTKGERVPYIVRMFDLYPSLLTLSGISLPEGLQAQTLFTWDGFVAVTSHRLVISETDRRQVSYDDWLTCVINGRFKLIHDRRKDSQTFYDRVKHPKELESARSESQDQRLKMLRCLRLQQEQNTKLAAAFGSPEWTGMDRETQEQLKALGYLP
ncbi:MAG: sulfatase [Candidatus Hydrogenedentes bacterium]|nr:sulfatase [Candidatus Hydrogenedentota bacterium]